MISMSLTISMGDPPPRENDPQVSLRTQMLFVCWISLLWNLYFLYFSANGHMEPVFLEILYRIPLIHNSGLNYIIVNEIYYIVQILIVVLAFIGVYSTSPMQLSPLMLNEALIVLIYYGIFTAYIFGYGPFQDPSVSLVLIIVIIVYKQNVLFQVIRKYWEECVAQQELMSKQTNLLQKIYKSTPWTHPPPYATLLPPV